MFFNIKNNNMLADDQKIDRIKKNLFYRSWDAITDYKKFDWQTYADKVNSSQAFAIDFWGCVKVSPQKDKIINTFFNKNCTNWKIIFEYTDKSLLSEIGSTQIDVIIESDNCTLFLESKFTEPNGGKCSQTAKTTYYDFQCNGNYEKQTNPVNKISSKCALTGKGIKYWENIDKLTNFSKDAEYQPCPFKEGEFQWMRNICFAEAYSKKHNKKTTENYLVYYNSPKCPISKKVENQTYLGKLKDNIINSDSFRALSYNDLLNIAISCFNSSELDEKQVWIDLKHWMKEKESKS